MEAALEQLIASAGYEEYVPGPVVRRVRDRMRALACADDDAYCEFVRSHPGELEVLRAAIPNACTAFFRDAAVWIALATHVLPSLLERQERVRVWSAGCSTGEEAYSLAMLLAEQVGVEAVARRVTFFATDVSEPRLARARSGGFARRALDGLPADFRAKYFAADGPARELRALIRFQRHDLLRDPPLGHMDLLLCRNVTLYLRRAAQGYVFAKLLVALRGDGVLFAGPADGLLEHASLFRRLEHCLYAPRASVRREALSIACRPRA